MIALPTDKNARKERPITRGVLDDFPNAIAEVARVSFIGNQQHNPGEPMHWSRGKSPDHADCVIRHLIERGTIDDDGLRHSAKAAWRALALLQEELEAAAVPHPNPMGDDPTTWERDQFMEDAAKDIDGAAFLIRLGCDPKVAVHIVAGTTLGDSLAGKYVYIAGPMRGYNKFNFPAFDAARDRFVQNGWNVISPADIDRAAGVTESTLPSQTTDSKPFVVRDFFTLLFIAHKGGGAIAMLPGWEKSTGAAAEFFLARWFGLKVLDAETMRPLNWRDFEDDELGGTVDDFLKKQEV